MKFFFSVNIYFAEEYRYISKDTNYDIEQIMHYFVVVLPVFTVKKTQFFMNKNQCKLCLVRQLMTVHIHWSFDMNLK
jgi:hypothetical protein